MKFNVLINFDGVELMVRDLRVEGVNSEAEMRHWLCSQSGCVSLESHVINFDNVNYFYPTEV